jgi:trehalose 6-phosphate phosphatase
LVTHALTHGTRSAAALEPHANRAFFLDVDGTLLPLAPTPGQVAVAPAVKHTLAVLHAAAGGAVALISGRAISDIDRLFAPLRFPAAGQHGIERRSAAGQIRRHAASSPWLQAIKQRLAPLAARHPGLLLEDKGLSLAVHYRQAPRLAGYLHRLLRGLADSTEHVALQPGKMVIEVRPAGPGKGGAIVDFMAEPPFVGKPPVFIGDDATDEYGFSVVNALGGDSIKVGRGRTLARWRFPNVRAVCAWLDACATAPPARRVTARSRSSV